MRINGFGINVAADQVEGRLAQLEAYLAYAQALGYQVAEIPVMGINVVINGELVERQVERVQAVLSRFNLRYSVHAPNRTNLAFGLDLALEQAVLRACLQFCHQIGARVLVYHSGLQALDAAYAGMAPLPDADELARGAEREVAALRQLAPLAADLGVTIAMENGDPHLWEYRLLKAHGKSPEDLPLYHARLRIPPIVAQIEAVGHPNVGMTLDLAHLHLAARAVGFDYLEAVSQAAPWVRHVHVNDNFGRLDVGFDAQGARLPYGEADLHLPPGWGKIPLAEAFARLCAYEGDVIVELKARYWDHFGEALHNLQEVLARVPA